MENKEDSVNRNKQYGRCIVQYPPDVSACVGCNACEIVCALVHDGKTGPMLRRIFLERDTVMLFNHVIYTCQHCVDHPCYDACPKKDKAMCIDEEKGIVYINPEFCIGCRRCIKACSCEPKRINFDKTEKKAVKCDLCRNRENGPACVEFCQVRCIGLSDQPLPPPPAPPSPEGQPPEENEKISEQTPSA